MKRLPAQLRGAIHPSRSNRNIGARGNGMKQLLRVFNGRRVVGIDEEDNFAGRLFDAPSYAVSLAPIRAIFDRTHRRVGGGVPLHHRSRLVRGAVVDDDDLSIPQPREQVRKNTIQSRRQAFGLVEGGNDDAVLGARIHSGLDGSKISFVAGIRPTRPGSRVQRASLFQPLMAMRFRLLVAFMLVIVLAGAFLFARHRRWPVKVLRDADAERVDVRPVPSSVAHLGALPTPVTWLLGGPVNHRLGPIEYRTFEVAADLKG